MIAKSGLYVIIKNMRNQSGQSLIELMVSVVIITVALAGIVAMFPYIIQKNVRIKMQSDAVNMAESELERLRSLSYFNDELNAVGPIGGVSKIEAKGNYLLRITVKYIDPTTGKVPKNYPTEVSLDTGLKEITVSVKRKDNVGAQVNLISYFSKARPGKG